MNYDLSIHNNDKRPSHIITQIKHGTWWNQTVSLLPMLCSPNVRPPTRGLHTNRSKNSLPMQSVCKKLHHVRTRKLYSCMIHKNVRQNKYLPGFPCTKFQFPMTSKWSRPILMIWWIFFNTFSLHFLFPQFLWQLWNHFEISSHVTWRNVYPRITTQTLIP